MTPARECVPAAITSALRLDSIVFREVRYRDEFEMSSHTHEDTHLFVCLAGVIRHQRGKECRSLAPSSLALVPGGETHANRFGENVRTFEITLQPAWIERLGVSRSHAERPAEYDNGPPNWLAERMYREFRHQDDLTPLTLEGLTLELLAQIARHQPERSERGRPQWLSQAEDYLRAHFTERLSLTQIALVTGVHPDHLTRAFRRHFRASPGDYVRRLRVEYACRLLIASDAPLAQIAVEAGFADQSHFHKNFRRLMGMTPAQFRATDEVGSRQRTLP